MSAVRVAEWTSPPHETISPCARAHKQRSSQKPSRAAGGVGCRAPRVFVSPVPPSARVNRQMTWLTACRPRADRPSMFAGPLLRTDSCRGSRPYISPQVTERNRVQQSAEDGHVVMIPVSRLIGRVPCRSVPLYLDRQSEPSREPETQRRSQYLPVDNHVLEYNP